MDERTRPRRADPLVDRVRLPAGRRAVGRRTGAGRGGPASARAHPAFVEPLARRRARPEAADGVPARPRRRGQGRARRPARREARRDHDHHEPRARGRDRGGHRRRRARSPGSTPRPRPARWTPRSPASSSRRSASCGRSGCGTRSAQVEAGAAPDDFVDPEGARPVRPQRPEGGVPGDPRGADVRVDRVRRRDTARVARQIRAHRVEPAVDVDHLAGDARRTGPRAGTRSRCRPASDPSMSQPSGARRSHVSAIALEPGDPLAGHRLDRPGAHGVHADPLRPEVAREVARDGLEARLRHAHPVVDRPGDLPVEVERDDRGRSAASQQRQHARRRSPSARYALVWIAVATLSHGVCRKLPPSASCGANAIACRNPSSRPHRVASSSRTAAICSWSFASISRTSGGSGRRRATFCVMLTVRPKFVRTISPALLLDRPGRRERDRLRRQHAGDQQPLPLEQHAPPSVSRQPADDRA